MSNIKERGPSAYNTAYDEFPEDLSIFPPHLWLFLVEIFLMLFAGAMNLVLVTNLYISFTPELYFFGLSLITISICIPNFMIAYGYSKGVLYLKYLCGFYIVLSLPSLFFYLSKPGLIAILLCCLVFWITTTNKFELFFQHRLKLGFWRREQLEKNKIRREVIKERKQKNG